MLRLVLRQVQFDFLRTILMTVVIGAVVGVILLLEGMAEGIYAQMREAVLYLGADLIAAKPGVTSMAAARSLLPQTSRREVEAVPGVKIAHPLTRLPVIYEQGGRRNPVMFTVYDSAGGPRRLVRGRPIQEDREIVIDESLAQRFGLGPGDEFVVSDFRFRIAGVSQGTAAFFTPFGFLTYDGLLEFYFKADLAGDISVFPLLSFLLIELEPGFNPKEVAKSIEERVPDVDVFEPDVLAANDVKLAGTLFGPVLRLLVGIGYLAGVLVVGLFMSASVGARRRQFGVLKALGFSNRALFGAVLAEAGLVTGLSVPLGILLAWTLGEAIHGSLPLYLVLPLEPLPLARTILACAGFAALGALMPIRAIAHIEPAMVFRS